MRSIREETSEAAFCTCTPGCSMCLPLERRKTCRGRRVLDGDREADADEHALLGGIEKTGDDADHFAIGGDQRPARVAGIHRRVELDEIAEDALALLRAVLALQARDHAGGGRGPDA